MSATLKYFTRNENCISENRELNNRTTLSHKVLEKVAEKHQGAKIYKQKIKDLARK